VPLFYEIVREHIHGRAKRKPDPRTDA
jgi:hypothetical protein